MTAAAREPGRNRPAVASVALVLLLSGCGPLPDGSNPPLLIDRATGPDLPDDRGDGGMGPGGANGGMGVGGGIQAGGGPAVP